LRGGEELANFENPVFQQVTEADLGHQAVGKGVLFADRIRLDYEIYILQIAQGFRGCAVSASRELRSAAP
jgi:hypothetical protein